MNEDELRARLEYLEHEVAVLRGKYKQQVSVNAAMKELLERILLHFAERDAALIVQDILRAAGRR